MPYRYQQQTGKRGKIACVSTMLAKFECSNRDLTRLGDAATKSAFPRRAMFDSSNSREMRRIVGNRGGVGPHRYSAFFSRLLGQRGIGDFCDALLVYARCCGKV